VRGLSLVRYRNNTSVSSEGCEGSRRCACYDIIDTIVSLNHHIMLEYYVVSVDVVLTMAWHKNAAEMFSS